MKNLFCEAKLLWNKGKRKNSFQLLCDYLKEKVGEDALAVDMTLYENSESLNFDSFLYCILNNNKNLPTSFSIVFYYLWQIAPYQGLIISLLEKDFSQPSFYELYDLKEFGIEKKYEEDNNLIVTVLVEAAKKGILTSHEVGSAGAVFFQTILSKKMIEEVDEAKWGDLKLKLLEKLPIAYEETPKDCWKRLAEQEPVNLISRLLYILFSEHNHPSDMVWSRLTTIKDQMPGLQTELLKALQDINLNYSDQDIKEMVAVDGMRTYVQNGKQWIKLFATAIENPSEDNVRKLFT